MMKQTVKIICTLVILASFTLPAAPKTFSTDDMALYRPLMVDDFDPLVEKIYVTVHIKEIRALDTIDIVADPDFYVRVSINDKEFVSDVWRNTKYLENLNWSVSSEVPKTDEFVDISIALWDKNVGVDLLCDISPEYGILTQKYTAELTYSIATGIWWGDDCTGGTLYNWYGDVSGYGRLNGCDDNSIYQEDRDCELWFDITQNDYDGDGIPYWAETTIYHTDPTIDDRGRDDDEDGVPIEWEHKFGLLYFEWGHNPGYYTVFDPFTWEDHEEFDHDNDGLTNVEEYKTWQWGSDPFRRDLFLEIDQMEKGPAGQGSTVPPESFDIIRDAFARQNIVWHTDDGRLGGGEMVPFKEAPLSNDDLAHYYWNYFMHQDANNWRRGVFHWALIGYNHSWAKGFAFGSRISGVVAIDCFFLSTKFHDARVKSLPIIDSLIRKTFDSEKQRASIYAGSIMHETGHVLNIRCPGVDNQNTYWPWQPGFWQYASYKSCMNYRYVLRGLNDYSNGCNGKNDHDDWGTLDLTYFNPRTQW